MARSDWQRRSDRFDELVAYALLVTSVALALPSERPVADRLVTGAIAVVAAAWIYAMYTRSPKPRRDHRVRMAVYLTVLLALAAALMSQHLFFFIFAITGFFHASVLRPWPLTVIAVAVTSILINTIITGFPWPNPDLWFLYGAVIVVQTAAIGFGSVIGEQLAAVSEQRRQALVDLEAAHEENAGLQRQLLAQAREAGVLDERGRMAVEIHDTIAHGLTGIITQLEAAEHAKERPADWQRHVDNAARLARDSLSEARRSLEASLPVALVDASLPDALSEVAERWTTLTGVPVEVTTTGESVPLHPEIEAALLRTAQEALANVGKHANATRVGLTLSYMGDVVTLDVRDDGIGFEVPNGTSEPGGGFGLTGMRQRVSRVAGTLAIESEPGGGTAVSARVPAVGAQPAAPGP